MPPGTVPPFIMRFDAGSVPVGNPVFSSETRSVAEMQDAALNLVRPLFATLPGVSAPPPFGGSARSIVVNVKPDRLRAYNMAPDEIVSAITAANIISPSGNMPIGTKYPMVPLNAVVNIKDLESVPIRTGVYPAIFLRDLGTVQDASDILRTTLQIPHFLYPTWDLKRCINSLRGGFGGTSSISPKQTDESPGPPSPIRCEKRWGFAHLKALL